jgi:RNA polymerase sigma-70 factor (ECF subfamily)
VTDQDLVKAILSGERQASRELVTTYQPLVFSVIRHFSQHEADMEDMAQETFLEVFRSLRHFRNDASLATWIYRVAFTRGLNQAKKARRRWFFERPETSFGDQDHQLKHEATNEQDASVPMQNQERERILKTALSQLPDTQRMAFILSKYEGKSNQQIAEIMDTSIKAVESLQHRAKQTLRKLLSYYYIQNMKQ